MNSETMFESANFETFLFDYSQSCGNTEEDSLGICPDKSEVWMHLRFISRNFALASDYSKA